MHGRGNIGMLAVDDSAADNAGKSRWIRFGSIKNDTTTLRTDLPSSTAIDYGVGMATGTNSGGGAKATVLRLTNKAVISLFIMPVLLWRCLRCQQHGY